MQVASELALPPWRFIAVRVQSIGAEASAPAAGDGLLGEPEAGEGASEPLQQGIQTVNNEGESSRKGA